MGKDSCLWIIKIRFGMIWDLLFGPYLLTELQYDSVKFLRGKYIESGIDSKLFISKIENEHQLAAIKAHKGAFCKIDVESIYKIDNEYAAAVYKLLQDKDAVFDYYLYNPMFFSKIKTEWQLQEVIKELDSHGGLTCEEAWYIAVEPPATGDSVEPAGQVSTEVN